MYHQADQKNSQIVLDVIPPHYNLHHGQPSPPQSPNQFQNNNKGEFSNSILQFLKTEAMTPTITYTVGNLVNHLIGLDFSSGTKWSLKNVSGNQFLLLFQIVRVQLIVK